MKIGQRFFQVKVEGRDLSFYGGLAEIAKLLRSQLPKDKP